MGLLGWFAASPTPARLQASPGTYVVGLDLAQTKDYTAAAVLQRTDGPKADYVIRALRRFERGTSYPVMVDRVKGWFDRPPLTGATLAVDQTGVGRPVVDMFQESGVNAAILPVTITGGHQVAHDDRGGYHVPKKELVSVLAVLIGSRRLVASPNIKEGKTLARELQTFTAKITPSANETFGAWREGDHDDLVLAVALAAWVGERGPCWSPGAIATGGRSVVSQAPGGVFAGGPTNPRSRPGEENWQVLHGGDSGGGFGDSFGGRFPQW